MASPPVELLRRTVVLLVAESEAAIGLGFAVVVIVGLVLMFGVGNLDERLRDRIRSGDVVVYHCHCHQSYGPAGEYQGVGGGRVTVGFDSNGGALYTVASARGFAVMREFTFFTSKNIHGS